MKNMVNRLSNIFVLLFVIVIFLLINSYREFSFCKRISKEFIVFYSAVSSFYDKYAEVPQEINEIDTLINHKIINDKFFKNLQIKSKNDTVFFIYNYSTFFLRNDLILNTLKLNPTLINIYISKKPRLKYRFFQNGIEYERVKNELDERIKNYNEYFINMYKNEHIYFYNKRANIIIYFSKKAENYFYYSTYKIDSIGDNYLFDIKNQVSGILKKENIKKIEIPLTLPAFYPIPPPNFDFSGD